jgi:hypothetical protein
VIGLDHGRIYTAQTRAVIRGGGELVSFYAQRSRSWRRPFRRGFRRRASPAAKSESPSRTKALQLIVSASIPQ